MTKFRVASFFPSQIPLTFLRFCRRAFVFLQDSLAVRLSRRNGCAFAWGILSLIFVFNSTAIESGFAQEIDGQTDSWGATDRLGRTLPSFNDVGDRREDKFVAMFYFLWLGRHGEEGPYNISQIQTQDPNAMNEPDNPLWGKMYAPHHWGESIFNYYVGEDESVLRKHAQMLADAGVDVICFDVTNQLTYPESYRPLFKVFSEMQREGNRVPKVAFLCPFWTPTKVVLELWNDVYRQDFYSDVWFYWKGKPLILADPALLVDSANQIDNKNGTPTLLTLDGSIGLNFEAKVAFKEIRTILPTWTEKDSELTLVLKRDSFDGDVLRQTRATGIQDNRLYSFSFEEPLPPGRYYFEASRPKGKVGLYSLPRDSKNLQQNPDFVWNESFVDKRPIDATHLLQIIPADDPFSEIKNFFTFRAPQPDYFVGPQKANQWSWLEVYPQHEFYNENGETEEICVGVAQNAVAGKLGVLSNPKSHGRSFHNGSEPDSKGQDTTGRNFQEQWDRALKIDPEIVFVTGWNEWIAGRFDKNAPFNGATPVSFVDQCNQEYSRDIEPMIGGHSDDYFYQLIANVRKFKGVRPSEPTCSNEIQIDGDFADWATVRPEYRDTVGDPVRRDCRGWGAGTRYINETGRNDLVAAKVSAGSNDVWFYAETKDPIVGDGESNWMLLLIDVDSNPQTGLLGFDLIVRRESANRPNSSTVYYCFDLSDNVDDSSLDVSELKPGESGSRLLFGRSVFCRSLEISCRWSDNRLELAIPRSVFDATKEFVARSKTESNAEVASNSSSDASDGAVSFALRFKWADNILTNGDWSDFSVNGDAAPNDRFLYLFEQKPGDFDKK